MPFRRSELDTDKYSFVFIDTPGSNNGDEAQKIHLENLEEGFEEQTNALPIRVMNRNSLDSNDANDLLDRLKKNEDGFALQNCIIAISMSDQLVEQQLSEEMPEKIKRGANHPTIMYVSPIAAIGEKKADKHVWIDQAYRQIYEKKMGDLSEVNPPSYNETPCGRKMDDARRRMISPLLYASGIPSLETEINYYAYRFAEFKKCTNGRKYLITALDLADNKLQEAKEQLNKDRQAKIEEQKGIRAKLMEKINKVPLPAVNDVISSVYKDFTSALDTYCKGIEPLVRETWEQYKDKENSIDNFERAIADHCQMNLYDAHYEDINSHIKNSFVVLIKEYMDDVKKCVTDEYSKISDEAQIELEDVFTENKKGPQLQDVSVGTFNEIKLGILHLFGKLGFDWAQEKLINDYSILFQEKIKGSKKSFGQFAKQCIAQPAEQYSQQIKDWSKGYKKSINETLDKDNAILSQLDEKIIEMEGKIDDMEKRLDNLSDVRKMLQHVLPENSEV